MIYLTETKEQIYVKGYGFLLLAKKIVKIQLPNIDVSFMAAQKSEHRMKSKWSQTKQSKN